jgi:carbamoyl-phosphate synthase large subunit
MKSIGENMGIGEDFASAFAKAWALTQTQDLPHWSMSALRQELACPTDLRMSALFSALEQGMPLADIEALTGISAWFLQAFKTLAPKLKTGHLGFWGFRQIDTLAGEFPAQTAYLYGGQALEYTFGPGPWVLILGSGPYGIGSSVEFDYCCVSAIYALQSEGYKVALFNSNPETLSTDCDLADALIFEPLLPESLNAVMAALRPVGIVASLGGQRPQNLLQVLPRHWPFWGTPVGQILRAENRLAFALALDELQIPQAPWSKVTSLAEALAFGEKVGYPLIYRPAFVLGGGGMRVIENAQALDKLGGLLQIHGPLPRTEGALLNRFLAEAKEFELDGIARLGQLEYYLFSENIEPSGIHSGDSQHVFPAQSLSPETRAQALAYALKLAKSFELHGLFNLQFFYHQGAVLLIEANLRASRNLPFLSHVSRQNLVKLAITRMLANTDLAKAPVEISADQVGIRVPTFSWQRMRGAKRELGVEMKATGEFCLLADSFENVLQLCYNFPDFCAFTPSWCLSKGE